MYLWVSGHLTRTRFDVRKSKNKHEQMHEQIECKSRLTKFTTRAHRTTRNNDDDDDSDGFDLKHGLSAR